ncbi:hypothetical protein [Acinetobacter rudis]|uniref:Uncharacterized protein n=1 Tax=Acinetobacter rudis CIP 110305 TaxID=421052 RepID=S3P4K3_9GAMM|nr:hypothetical protein [Acinetobacter rudis]EPF73736.1 hypothetical protein F945_01895 [Acinetobacter rudis CIP 110305]
MDLSALATFFTGLVALFIYFNWRIQKSSEVIAIEAKDLLKKINFIWSKLEINDTIIGSHLILNLDYKESFIVIEELIFTLDFLDDKVPNVVTYKNSIKSFLNHLKHLRDLANKDEHSWGIYSEDSQEQIKIFSKTLSDLKKPIRKLARYEK